jgi:hypothetical protein
MIPVVEQQSASSHFGNSCDVKNITPRYRRNLGRQFLAERSAYCLLHRQFLIYLQRFGVRESLEFTSKLAGSHTLRTDSHFALGFEAGSGGADSPSAP